MAGHGQAVSLVYLGHNIALAEGETIVGRGLACQLRLNDPSVSREHMKIRVEDGAVTLEDLGSRNGTELNQMPATGSAPLKHGDVISIGNCRLQVRIDVAERPFDESTVSKVQYPTPVVPPAFVRVSTADERQQRCPECKSPVSVADEQCLSCGYSWGDFRPGAVTQQVKVVDAETSGIERRRHRRHRVQVPVLYTSENLTIETLALNLSLSGVFVRTQILDEQGTVCELTLMVDGAPGINLRGRVKRVVEQHGAGEPLGLGIAFTDLTADERNWLSDTIVRFGDDPGTDSRGVHAASSWTPGPTSSTTPDGS